VKYRFFDDYSEGVHPQLMSAIAAYNGGQDEGYGLDEVCRLARERIMARFEVDADVHFVAGATQANLIAVGSMLRSYQGIIAPTTGHIVVHETGAVEATGHRIVTVEAEAGKLSPALIDQALSTHHDEHTVMPTAVFLTHATEAGTVYTPEEFSLVVGHAKDRGLTVFVDGARLAMALGASSAMTPVAFASSGVDVFTVGGTKVGGMFGEAIVIVDEGLRRDFRYHLKQRGALLAKGRFLGAQFARFFDEDDLWLELGRRSNENAQRLSRGIEAIGLSLAQAPETNQVFVILPDDAAAALAADYGFHIWERQDDGHCVIRLVCSWATAEAAIDRFLVDAAAATDTPPVPSS
jgi:threonine aldolase